MCHDDATALTSVFPASGLFAHLRHLKKKTNIKNHREDRASGHYPALPGGPWWFLAHVSFPCLLEGCELPVFPSWYGCVGLHWQTPTGSGDPVSWAFCCLPRQGFGKKCSQALKKKIWIRINSGVHWWEGWGAQLALCRGFSCCSAETISSVRATLLGGPTEHSQRKRTPRNQVTGCSSQHVSMVQPPPFLPLPGPLGHQFGSDFS